MRNSFAAAELLGVSWPDFLKLPSSTVTLAFAELRLRVEESREA